MINMTSAKRRFTMLHLICGMGGGAEGYFDNIGGVDVDPLAIEDYERITGTEATVLDLNATLAAYGYATQQAIHGCGDVAHAFGAA